MPTAMAHNANESRGKSKQLGEAMEPDGAFSKKEWTMNRLFFVIKIGTI